MKVTVSVIDNRTTEGTSNREFYTYYSAYKYIRSHSGRSLLVRIECGNLVDTLAINGFINFMNMEEK